MDFQDWKPYYDKIIDDFHFDRAMDERSASLLEGMIPQHQIPTDDNIGNIIGKEVTIYGGGPNLEDHILKYGPIGTIISAGSATSYVMDASIEPDIFVTDLDGKVESEIELNRKGAVGFILGHGDNPDLIERFVPDFKGRIVPTTQSFPYGRLRNFGGFTDGDRAVCLARHFGAEKILLLGFDFVHPRSKYGMDETEKIKKLRWAKRIIFDLNPGNIKIICK